MGLSPRDFDVITSNQFITISKKYYKKFKRESEVYSLAVCRAIGNAFREEGTLYRKLWTEDSHDEQKEVEIIQKERAELFKEVGINV